jgi:hypoxanthine phosphoribosyltransferase
MQKSYLEWTDIEALVGRLVEQVPRDYDALLAIARGGLVPCCLLSEQLDMRNILVAAVMYYTGVGQTMERPLFLQFPDDILLAGKRILVIDDVWDTGKTIMAVKDRLRAVGCYHDTATLHYKPARSHYPERPEHFGAETDDWIVYPWDPEHERNAT